MDPDDTRLLAVSWNGSAFVSLDLAAMTPGERLVLADTSDVWASMM